MARRRMSASSAPGTARLPNSAFAYPAKRAYPINTVGRARSALSRASHSGNSGTYQHVARAVRRKWGDRVSTVGPTRGTTARPGHATRGGRRRTSGRR